MLKSSTIQLLRFQFSFFLMPVFWFALSSTDSINPMNAVLIFIILHLIVYPSSNGYNSYMDRDTDSIGGIKSPMQPTLQLFYTTIIMDITALIAGLVISIYFSISLFLYILASRAYSYRGIRLKKNAVTGYLTVIIFQGSLTYFMVYHGVSSSLTINVPWPGMLSAALLVGGFYPLTQIYQHVQDKKDGVTTLSYLLGYKGTFIFTAVIFAMAMFCIALYLQSEGRMTHFYIMQIFFVPVLVYFGWWFYKVSGDTKEASYTNTMRMNIIASLFTNAAFIFLLLMKRF